MFRETLLGPEMSITLGAGDSDGGEGARMARHTIATRLVTPVRYVSKTRLLDVLHMYLFLIAPVIFTIM